MLLIVKRCFIISLMSLRNIAGDEPAADIADIPQCYMRELTEEMKTIGGNRLVQLLKKFWHGGLCSLNE